MAAKTFMLLDRFLSLLWCYGFSIAVIKLFGGISRVPKSLEIEKKFVFMNLPDQNASHGPFLSEKYAPKLSIAFKMALSFCFN